MVFYIFQNGKFNHFTTKYPYELHLSARAFGSDSDDAAHLSISAVNIKSHATVVLNYIFPSPDRIVLCFPQTHQRIVMQFLTDSPIQTPLTKLFSPGYLNTKYENHF